MELWASWAKLIAEINGEEKKELKVVQKNIHTRTIITLLPYRRITTHSTTPFLITIQWISKTYCFSINFLLKQLNHFVLAYD